MLKRSSTAALALAIACGAFAACLPEDATRARGGSGGDPGEGSGGQGVPAGTGGATTPAGSGGATGGGNDVCARWKADRANLSEGTWSGDIASCNAGDMTAEARDNALRLVN